MFKKRKYKITVSYDVLTVVRLSNVLGLCKIFAELDIRATEKPEVMATVSLTRRKMGKLRKAMRRSHIEFTVAEIIGIGR